MLCPAPTQTTCTNHQMTNRQKRVIWLTMLLNTVLNREYLYCFSLTGTDSYFANMYASPGSSGASSHTREFRMLAFWTGCLRSGHVLGVRIVAPETGFSLC